MKQYDFLKPKLEELKAQGHKTVRSKIWNMYNYELLRRLALKDGYTLRLIKREYDDTHIFEVDL